jgi:restriction endonuclease Mrr
MQRIFNRVLWSLSHDVQQILPETEERRKSTLTISTESFEFTFEYLRCSEHAASLKSCEYLHVKSRIKMDREEVETNVES